MPKMGMTSAARIVSATPAATQRHRTTRLAQAVHARDARPSWRMRGQSTLGPMLPSSAGSSVRMTKVLTSGISMPPMPMLRSSGTGMTSSAQRLMATVPALARTA